MNARRRISRRRFVQLGSVGVAAAALPARKAQAAGITDAIIAIPDDGWRLWPDTKAEWENDELFLPDEVNLAALPVILSENLQNMQEEVPAEP